MGLDKKVRDKKFESFWNDRNCLKLKNHVQIKLEKLFQSNLCYFKKKIKISNCVEMSEIVGIILTLFP